jgi:transposase
LPPYSPKLNPIEQVWRTVKKELSSDFIEDKEFLVTNFRRIFYEQVDKPSFTKKWIKEYLIEAKYDLNIFYMYIVAVLPY